MLPWQVESSGDHIILVVRRLRRMQQDIARDGKGRIIWFKSKSEAQLVADRLNLTDGGRDG